MKSLYLKAPGIGDLLIQFPARERGRHFFDAARTHFGFEMWAGALYVSIDAERGEWWRPAAAAVGLALVVATLL